MSIKKIAILIGIIASYCTIYAFCHKFFLDTLSKLSLSLVMAIILLLVLFLTISIAYIISLHKKLKEETGPLDISDQLKEAQERLRNLGKEE